MNATTPNMIGSFCTGCVAAAIANNGNAGYHYMGSLTLKHLL